MPDEIDKKLLDKRTAERYLRNGQLDEKAYEKHLKSLEDVTEKSAPVETVMDDDIDDDYDDEEDETEEGGE